MGNQSDGHNLYAEGDAKTRQWFERQWKIWPERADQRFTTNLSFHYGGVQAFRKEHGREPAMSAQLKENVQWHDKHPEPKP